MTQPSLVNLHPNKYSQEFHYYPFVVKLDICVGSCNTLNDLSDKVCVSNKTKDLNLSVFNMITGTTNESKRLTKHIPWECKYEINGKKCNSNQWWNNGKWQCECKERHVCGKDYIWDTSTCSCENRKYFTNIMNDPAIMCDKVIESHHEETKTIPTNFNEKKAICKR